MRKVGEKEEVRATRDAYKEFKTDNNPVWCFQIEKVFVAFPYGYDFAAAFEEVRIIISIYGRECAGWRSECCVQASNSWKWLKLIHGVQRKPFTAESPLPPDLLISVNVSAPRHVHTMTYSNVCVLFL